MLVVPVDGDLARSRSPAPPARPCCPACEQRSEAGDAIVAAVADAAREAVRAAFAELQPALLQALASRPKVTTFDRSETQLRAAVVARTAGRDSGDEVPQRRSSRRKTTTSHKRVSHADVEDVMVLPPPPRPFARNPGVTPPSRSCCWLGRCRARPASLAVEGLAQAPLGEAPSSTRCMESRTPQRR